MSAVEYWKNRAESHHAQSLRVQDQSKVPDDFWAAFASAFREDPYRSDDHVLDRLSEEVGLTKTLLDVGGGAGRFALALALRSSRVIVVEPSQSMLRELRAGAEEHGIQNVDAVESTWEEAEVEPADVILCSHVLYGVVDIVPFVRKLEAKARDRVLALMFVDSPQSELAEPWEMVHGEERITLPALPGLLRVLWEMDIYPDLQMVGTRRPQAFEDRAEALQRLRQRLYVVPDTEQDRRLKAAMDELLVETTDGLTIRNTQARHEGLLMWRPASSG